MTAARSVAVRRRRTRMLMGPTAIHIPDRSQRDLIFQVAFVEVDVPDLPSVTSRSKQCLKPSDTGRATDPVVRRPS